MEYKNGTPIKLVGQVLTEADFLKEAKNLIPIIKENMNSDMRSQLGLFILLHINAIAQDDDDDKANRIAS